MNERTMPARGTIVGDWSFMQRIGARPSTKPFEPGAILPKTTGILRQGGTITLANIPEEWKRLPIFLDEQSLPFVFYISDQKNLLYQIGPGYKFHFRWCHTLEDMQGRGRIQRYRAKYDICNPNFEINDGKNNKKLKVCLNCCDGFWFEYETAYSYFDANSKRDIVEKFRMPEFFEKFGKINLPESTHPGGGDGYPRDWPKVARREKEKVGWKCQDPNHEGNRDFSHDKKNLHVHHRNGVSSHNVSANLEVVCHTCHAKKPMHGHMKKRP